MELDNPDRFSIFLMTGKDVCDGEYKIGQTVLCKATYISKHPVDDLHIINVKMYPNIPTNGIDLIVSDSVIHKITEVNNGQSVKK